VICLHFQDNKKVHNNIKERLNVKIRQETYGKKEKKGKFSL
jgi:hypothetical protein